ncbi:CoA pyrophosphatase [Enterobacillus tribolii]|uniref:NUDIX domain-containing protein n=1 Tax=Enterobacillus tribolii TaxID=1487935 RepID=A0A370R474_9GAMM|nr:CoA pyrophosphatase [Enterobacillus tribolii]MBW7983175.1 CoA pyrophosphatase [Enterobacillus tribolii]RDK97231.1 NUDIX domain-containing protein [Enterobacillus tribolii]
MTFSPELEQFITRFQLQMPVWRSSDPGLRQAAVLIPIINRPEPTLLLTQRSSQLRKHAGQVAFPGGAADPGDGSPIFTALREAQEEVAIAPENVHILGSLPAENSVTGFQVTPVLGILPADITLSASDDEVAAMFEMPLREALALSRYHPLDIHRRGGHHRVYLSWYQRFFVWGLTAAIIRRLAQQIAV